MANTQIIQRRIKSVKNTSQITKAMELVAASKLRRVQEASLRSRAYKNTAREILTRISELTNVSEHELYQARPVQNRLYIVISSDRGLAGAYNNSIMKMFAMSLLADHKDGIKTSAIVVGRKIGRFASKLDAVDIIGSYKNFPDQPHATDVQPILSIATQLFISKKIDDVVVIYTDFKSSLVQEVKSITLLPATFSPTHDRSDLDSAMFEPSPLAVLESITPKLVELQLIQALLESAASEHAMRMLAMKNASDNAGDLIDDLTLEFNSARQAGITQELAEISAGVGASV